MPKSSVFATLSTFIALLVFFMNTNISHAHFLLNLNVRILHVEHLSDGVRIYLRLPMPYLVADLVGPASENGLPKPAPYTTNRMEDGKLVHYVDAGQLADNPTGLGILAADSHHLVGEDRRLAATVDQVRIHRVGEQPDYATLEEARQAFAGTQGYRHGEKSLYVGDAVVDVIIRYRAGIPVYNYSISSTLDPGLPGQENTANLVLDYSPDGTKIFRARGLLVEPVEVSRSAISAIVTFIKEGIRHILEGLDHVLFVLCLVLGTTRIKSLAWRVTGFTIGHSVTLSAGFFGFVPSGAWFVPAIETGIALSIIYAAVIAIIPRALQSDSERNLFFVTSAIGLLHGLGFSFVLHKILQVDSPDIWQSLLAFNIGVEIGQLIIILAAWPAFCLVQKFGESIWRTGQIGIASICILIATAWVWERGLLMIDSF